jgi:hypothetical protein
MGRASDARKEIAFPGRLGGAGRAHVEGEWLGRMFRAGRHARYVPWSPEGRGGAGVRGATLSRLAAPSPHHLNSARISRTVLKSGGALTRESPGGGYSPRVSIRMVVRPDGASSHFSIKGVGAL